MKNIDAIKAMDDEQLATLFSVIMSNAFNSIDKHIYFCGVKPIETTPHEHYRDLFKSLLNEEDSIHKFFDMFAGFDMKGGDK
jgi:hypothetical protein